MANTTFTDNATLIVADFMNDVNDTVYDVLGDGVNAPATAADARTNLGLGTMATQAASAVAITGGTITGATVASSTVNGDISGNATNVNGTVAVNHGGTGLITTTAYSPVISGTTATGAFQASLGPGTSGQVLTSAGAGAVPTWSNASVADGAITAAKLDGAQSGAAPIFGARAWGNFNGQGTIAIRAGGNFLSVTDGGAGLYRVNFTTAMADANYAALVWFQTAADGNFMKGGADYTTSGFSMEYSNTAGGGLTDSARVTFAVFR